MLFILAFQKYFETKTVASYSRSYIPQPHNYTVFISFLMSQYFLTSSYRSYQFFKLWKCTRFFFCQIKRLILLFSVFWFDSQKVSSSNFGGENNYQQIKHITVILWYWPWTMPLKTRKVSIIGEHSEKCHCSCW